MTLSPSLLPTGLASAMASHRPGSETPHTVVVLPSYSMGPSLLAHYAQRLPAMEHRYLLGLLGLPRIPGCELVFVTSRRPEPEVLAYYRSLAPEAWRDSMAARTHIVEVPDDSPRSVTDKLLDRPDLVETIRTLTRNRPSFIEPWNVTHTEMELARRLDLPVNGTPPHLWPLAFKSAGRRLLRLAGVPVPWGYEDLHSVADVVAAAERIRAERPGTRAVVVKADNSGGGDGNRVLDLGPGIGAGELRARLDAEPAWFRADVADGCVVEELVTGPTVTSPSVQADIEPDGRVRVVSTHEQVLSGPDGQVYEGCRFPAKRVYAARLAVYGEAVGRLLAVRGARGRFCVDFMAARSTTGRWDVRALEINLRKGGTTHPFDALRHLVPGDYRASGSWRAAGGGVRCYRATDNLVDPAWLGRPASDVIATLRGAGLEFDPATGTGVVLHMLSGLAIDGRLGLTAIGTSVTHATALHRAAVAALSLPR